MSPPTPALPPAVSPLGWSDPGPSDAAARRWACQALHQLAVELDAAQRAVGLLFALLADRKVAQPGQLGPRLAAIDDAAVAAHEGGQLCAVLSVHGHNDAAARLRDAQRRRRDAVQTLRRLADLDRRRLLDAVAARDCLRQAAEDLIAVGRGIAATDRDVLSGLSNLSNKTNLNNLTDIGVEGGLVCYTESRATDPRLTLGWGISMSDSGEFQVSVVSGAER